MLALYLALLPPWLLFSGKAAVILLFLFLLIALVRAWPLQVNAHQFAHNITHSIYTRFILLMMAWPLITVAFSMTKAISFQTWSQLTLWMIFGALSIWVVKQNKLRLPKYTSLWFAAGYAFACISLLWNRSDESGPFFWIFMHVPESYHLDYDRYIHMKINNAITALCVFTWPLSFALIRSGYRKFGLYIPFLFLPGVLLMHSLSAKLGYLAAFAAFYLLRLLPRTMTFALCIGLPLVLVMDPILLHYTKTHVADDSPLYHSLPLSAQHRLHIWYFTLDRIAEKPWTGWGIDMSRNIPGGDEKWDYGQSYMSMHPHNGVLQVLLECGIIGFICTMLAFALVLNAWRKSRALEPEFHAAAGATIVAYLFSGLTAYGVWQGWWVAVPWLALALLMLYSHTRPTA